VLYLAIGYQTRLTTIHSSLLKLSLPPKTLTQVLIPLVGFSPEIPGLINGTKLQQEERKCNRLDIDRDLNLGPQNLNSGALPSDLSGHRISNQAHSYKMYVQ
jgi:hypothetical protein